jgi:ABC-2 type transport system permease protein
MNHYLYKQFYRNKAYIISLLILLFAGLSSLYTGKKFLDRNEEIIAKSASYQKKSLDKNIALHSDDIGLLLYYVKFNLVNEMPKLAALNIGMRDLNPSIQGVTIRNLEEQKNNSDFFNPANAAVGNFDFSFVLIFLFPLVIIAFCYNLISEDQEKGTWKLLSVQSQNLSRLIDAKLLIRFIAVSLLYFVLILIAAIYIKIPLDSSFLIFILIGLLYIIFWFVLCRWIIGFQKSSSWNALALVIFWMAMNFIIPMTGNMIIQKIYPAKEGLQAQIEQREGYHNKWDEAKKPTMQKFHKIYPQFSQYNVDENSGYSYTWYYAMQHLGDVESAESSKQYHSKMQKRNEAATYLGYLLPNINTQISQSLLAKTGMENQLNYAEGLEKFHEDQRLYFYPYIFSNQNGNVIDWTKQKVKTFEDSGKINLWQILIPYLIIIILLIILSQNKFRKLC